MPRGSDRPSTIFKAVLDAAARQLHIASNEATAFQHTGIRGDERAAALANFFRDHLPSTISVAKGEAIDFRDRRTGQLDILIYDADMASPISSQSENVLIPAESLLAVIEVKTTLTQNDLDACYAAAKKVREIRPFKQSFIAAREEGKAAEDGNFRCLYVVFSYGTNLSADNWLNKEFNRLDVSAKAINGKLNLVDVVYVLNRGMIRPAKNAGKINDVEQMNTFLEFYLHIVNFLRKEMPRRPAMDWQAYASKTSKGWVPLGPSNDV
jgi:hypothetical protein